MTDNSNRITRRNLIKRAGTMLGGAAAVAQLGLLSRSVAAMTEDATPRFLDEQQFLTVTNIVDLIVPETDTPGALTAGVHNFIDLMLADWASAERQARYVAGIEDIDRRAREAGVRSFSASSKAQQTALLRALDKEAFAEGAADTFFGEFKKMVLFAYYSSETGATVELQYQRIPVDYLPCVPIDDATRAWFWMGYSYGL